MKYLYPRYTREQNKGCKLTEKDLKKIHKLREEGLTLKEIAKELKFKVSATAIWYWCLTPEARKKNIRRRYLLWIKDYDESHKEEKHRKQVKSVLRKYYLMPEFRKYNRQFPRKYNKVKS